MVEFRDDRPRTTLKLLLMSQIREKAIVLSEKRKEKNRKKEIGR
jgi:hypothetical protein